MANRYAITALVVGLLAGFDVSAQTVSATAGALPQRPKTYQAVPSNVMDATQPLKGDDAPNGTMQASVDRKSVLKNPASYPDSEVNTGHQGVVAMTLLLDQHGAVSGVRVDRSSGFAALDKAAIKAASSWTYMPCYTANTPQVCWVRQKVSLVAVQSIRIDGMAQSPQQMVFAPVYMAGSGRSAR